MPVLPVHHRCLSPVNAMFRPGLCVKLVQVLIVGWARSTHRFQAGALHIFGAPLVSVCHVVSPCDRCRHGRSDCYQLLNFLLQM